MNGILCINKPPEFTSFDVIGKLRGILRIKRLGHAGTLDPMATGVLPVFVGNATKACDILPDSTKSYRAGFRTGLTTDTLDSTGTVTETFEKTVSVREIAAVIPQFTGDIMQLPPMYSAVKVGGRKLYDLARQGIEIEREKRSVHIDEIILEHFDEKTQEGTLLISCSKGTYIRTVIDDIGRLLRCGAIMTCLCRTSSSGFSLSQCYTFEDVEKARDEDRLENLLIPTERVFEKLPRLSLCDIQTKMYTNGVKLDLNRVDGLITGHNIYRIYGSDGLFIGTCIADREKGELKVGKNFK